MIDDNTNTAFETTKYEKYKSRPNIPYGEYQQMQQVQNTNERYQEKKVVWRSYHVIWFVVGIIITLLAFRFIFELLGANPYNTFVHMVYTLSYPLAGPFETIFGVTSVARSMFDWSILVAILVYFLIGYALVKLLQIIRPVSHDEINHRIHTI